MTSVAVFSPIVVGVNLTLTVQVPLGAIFAPQVVVAEKAASVVETPETVRVVVPVFVTVMDLYGRRGSGVHQAEAQRRR